MMELFCENSKRLRAVNYFRKKNSIADDRLGSKNASEVDYVDSCFIKLHQCYRSEFFYKHDSPECFKNEFFSIPEFLSIIEAELFANIILNEMKKFENSFQFGLKL